MDKRRDMLIKAASVVMTVVMLASCGQVKNIAYFQDKATSRTRLWTIRKKSTGTAVSSSSRKI